MAIHYWPSPLASLNWSTRAETFLSNAGIGSIQQLIEKTPQEIMKYRNVGPKTLIEIRFRLGKLGLSLQGDEVWTMGNFGGGYEQLTQRKAALELELATVCDQINEIDQARGLEKSIAEPIDEEAIYTEWKNGASFARLAQKFLTRPAVVSEVCWARLEADCESGNPPALSRKVERQFECSYCGARVVARYQSELQFPKCPGCGRRSKHLFS